MKPTKTCNLVRSIHKALKKRGECGPTGLPVGDQYMPHPESPDFRNEYLMYNLNRKIEVDDDSLYETTLRSFEEGENKCDSMNRLLLGRINMASKLNKRFLIRASQLILETIGEKPPSDLWAYSAFSGGASTSRLRKDAHVALKWWARPSLHVTPLALKHLLDFKKSLGDLGCVWDYPGALDVTTIQDPLPLFYKIVPGSRLDMVEKNYKTKRVILIEPDGNMFLQKGVGAYFKSRLRSVGIDLTDQTHNQRLAKLGSMGHGIATVDMKTASDLISLTIVALLLPPAWFELLYDLRSHLTSVDGEWRKLHKISSMGNGYTFELESLIFWALSKAVVDVLRPRERVVSIFGDDIIVADSVVPALTRLLHLIGFEVNTEKSYWKGPFRESCGKHYNNGAEVSPFFIRRPVENCISELYRLANQAYAWEGETVGPVTQSILRYIPVKHRNQIPVNWDETQGLKFRCEAMKSLVQRKRCRRYGTRLSFTVYRPVRLLGARIADECRWLHSIMCGHHLSGEGPLPERVTSDGDREYTEVSIPCTGDAAIP